jgi:hypothetical protein
MGWVIAAASATGTSHQASGQPCQDAHAHARLRAADGSGEIAILVVCDGAGTATHSDIGAAATAQSFVAHFARRLDSGLGELTREVVVEWLRELRGSTLRSIAHEEGCSLRDLACTLTAVVCRRDATDVVQLGDSLAAGRLGDTEQFMPFTEPQNGEYANSTYFVTGEADEDQLYVDQLEGAPVQVALMTDGVHRFAYDAAAKTIHSPLLKQLFKTLESAGPDAEDRLNQGLMSWLSSPKVLLRSDDDLTLVLAHHRADEDDELVDAADLPTEG